MVMTSPALTLRAMTLLSVAVVLTRKTVNPAYVPSHPILTTPLFGAVEVTFDRIAVTDASVTAIVHRSAAQLILAEYPFNADDDTELSIAVMTTFLEVKSGTSADGNLPRPMVMMQELPEVATLLYAVTMIETLDTVQAKLELVTIAAAPTYSPPLADTELPDAMIVKLLVENACDPEEIVLTKPRAITAEEPAVALTELVCDARHMPRVTLNEPPSTSQPTATTRPWLPCALTELLVTSAVTSVAVNEPTLTAVPMATTKVFDAVDVMTLRSADCVALTIVSGALAHMNPRVTV